MVTLRKTALQEMEPWVEGMDISLVSISNTDIMNGSPQAGDMIAHNPDNPEDRWLVAAQFIKDNYEIVNIEPTEKRVRFEAIETLVDSLTYTFVKVPDSTVTACYSFLPNGFQIGYGQSACIDPNLYNKEIGESVAKDNCIAASKTKLWELEGYALMKSL